MSDGLKSATFYTRWQFEAVKEKGYAQGDIGLHKRADGVWAITDLATGMRLDRDAGVPGCRTKQEAIAVIDQCRACCDVRKAFQPEQYGKAVKKFNEMVEKAEGETK